MFLSCTVVWALYIRMYVCLFVCLYKSISENSYAGINGTDANPGSIDKPFKTIAFARDFIRQLKNASKLPVGGVVVNIRSGSYDFTSEPLALTAEDSGEPNSPIV